MMISPVSPHRPSRFRRTLRHLGAGALVLGTMAMGTFAAATSPGAGGDPPAVPARTDDGFPVPQPGTAFSFPRDHGSHPDYRIEWWYLTGHLESVGGTTGTPESARNSPDGGGRSYGFQVTFFRYAGPLPEEEDSLPAADPLAGDRQIFSTHVALADIDGGQFLQAHRMDREGWNAAAATDTLAVRHGPWSLALADPETERMELVFSTGPDSHARLTLTPQQPLVVFGEDGTSRKGSDPAARSYYLTFPRLEVAGSLTVHGKERIVSGSAWMDHEVSSQQLGDDLAGWDWTAIQLEDGRSLKAYILRREDGTPSPFSRLVWIGPDGSQTAFRPGPDFQWTGIDSWASPHTGTSYPSTVRIDTRDPATGQPVSLRLHPRLDDQEVRDPLADNAYYEGACSVSSPSGLRGLAYLELVGYGPHGLPGGLR